MAPPVNRHNPSIRTIDADAKKNFVFSGHWLTLTISPILPHLSKKESVESVSVNFDETFQCDTAGALVIAQFLSGLNLEKKSIIPDEIKSLIGKTFSYPEVSQSSALEQSIEYIGHRSFEFLETVQSILAFLGEAVYRTYRTIKTSETFRWTSIYALIETIGIQAIGIISLISLLIGAVLCFQGVRQLEKFGAAPFAIDFLAVSILRELSVLMTAIVVAGRSGSSFTAQIGTMKLNQEVDAIRMMGLNPFHVLVIPRIIALIIALPLLVLVSIITASLGGMLIIQATIEIPYSEFWSIYQNAVQKTTFWTGMSKAPLFAMIIAVIGCYRGMQVKGSAESVGLMTTRSVVESIFAVIICDAIMSIFFTAMDW